MAVPHRRGHLLGLHSSRHSQRGGDKPGVSTSMADLDTLARAEDEAY